MFKIVTEQEIVTKKITEVEVTLLGFIGHKIKEARENEGSKISEISRDLFSAGHSLSGTTISKIEKGECPVKLQDLIAITDSLGLGLGDVLPVGVISGPTQNELVAG